MPVVATVTSLAVDNKAITHPSIESPISDPSTSAAVKLTWASADPLANYRVQYKLNSSGTWLDGIVTGLGATSANLFGLAVASSYDFQVRGERSGYTVGAYAGLTSIGTGSLVTGLGSIVIPTSIAISVTDTTATLTLTDTSDSESHWSWTLLSWPANDNLFGGYFEILNRTLVISSLEPNTSYKFLILTNAFETGGTTLTAAPRQEVYFTTALPSGVAPNGMVTPAGIPGNIYAELAADCTLSPAPASSASWSISGAPTGISITGTGTLNVTGRITGSPTQAGIFDAIAVATWVDTGVVRSASGAIRFLIDGGVLLSWLDRSTMDVQVDSTSRAITSSKAVGDTLWLKHGDDFNPYIVFRDGSRVLAPALTALRLKLFLADNLGAPALLDLRPAPPAVQFFGSYRAYKFSAKLVSPLLARIFAALNVAGGVESSTVACHLELSWKLGGQWISSKRLNVTLAQDAIRN